MDARAKVSRKRLITNLIEEYMIRRSVKELMCEDERLRQLMNIPIQDILRYRDMADTVDPEDALRFLADRFIDNCGISPGMRGFYDYCAGYWEEKLDLENNPIMRDKYHGAETFAQLLPYLSDKYYEGLLDEFDSCAMEDVKLRDILITQLMQEDDEKNKIILCAGICHCLPWGNIGLRWLDRYSDKDIEQGIINFQNRTLIEYRHKDDFRRYRTWQHIKVNSDTPKGLRRLVERWPDEFSEEEVAHLIILNERLVELQHEVMDQVKVITSNLQEQIAKGFHQYETFCIDGSIIIEPYEEDVKNELLETLCQFAMYRVIFANDETTSEQLASEMSNEIHWYANWSGIFHQLEKSHGLKLCRAFRDLFEEDEIFTISDIMKIKPEMLLPHVEINI